MIDGPWIDSGSGLLIGVIRGDVGDASAAILLEWCGDGLTSAGADSGPLRVHRARKLLRLELNTFTSLGRFRFGLFGGDGVVFGGGI